MAKSEIQWSAPEFHYYHKTSTWYWAMGGIALVIVGISLIQQNFLFALFVVVAAVLIVVWAGRSPKTVDFKLVEEGLLLNNKLAYPFEKLEGFAIIGTPEDPELSELVLRTKSNVHHWVKVIIATQRKDEVYEFLNDYLPELEYEESFIDHIGRILRF